MAQSADLLFLDEPTNDLDIPSREALEAVLSSYGGAMLVVSHDRYLLRRLAERVLWLHDGEATYVDGGYEQFEELARRGSLKAPPVAPKAVVASPAPKAERDTSKRRERDLRALAASEREVARLDEARAELEREFADPAIYEDRARVARLQRKLDDARSELEAAFARWEELSSAMAEASVAG
jgi:ATP-binding cassette subfamily F protein 3